MGSENTSASLKAVANLTRCMSVSDIQTGLFSFIIMTRLTSYPVYFLR